MNMIEVRIHGRGGQGNVVAAYLLAGAAIDEGWYAQAFPAFGAERRGAPVAAFVRIARDRFRRRCQVLAPHFVIVQDEALLRTGVTEGLRAGGGVLVNSVHAAGDLPLDGIERRASLPATRLAQETLGRPLPNTALLAALLALTGLLPPGALVPALARRFSGKLLADNERLIELAAAQVDAGLWREALDG
jgi:pyruvate ferredoxin oxidoreductase gamma subunit